MVTSNPSSPAGSMRSVRRLRVTGPTTRSSTMVTTLASPGTPLRRSSGTLGVGSEAATAGATGGGGGGAGRRSRTRRGVIGVGRGGREACPGAGRCVCIARLMPATAMISTMARAMAAAMGAMVPARCGGPSSAAQGGTGPVAAGARTRSGPSAAPARRLPLQPVPDGTLAPLLLLALTPALGLDLGPDGAEDVLGRRQELHRVGVELRPAGPGAPGGSGRMDRRLGRRGGRRAARRALDELHVPAA